jgi:tripartite motif-containing protein 71
MDRKMILAAAALWALTAVCVWGSWEYAGQWGEMGLTPGQFMLPTYVAVSASGNVYISDPYQARIQYFTSTGSLLGYWGESGNGPGQFLYAESLAIGPNNYLYVLESRNCRIQYFSLTGQYLGMWGSYGTGDGQFKEPHYVAIAPNGNVYVTDYGTYEIKYFTPTGSFLGKWGSRGEEPGQFGFLWDLAFAPNGTVYVTDGQYDRIQYFTSTGSYLGMWYGPPGFNITTTVAVSSDGTVFASLVDGWDFMGVGYFTPTGSLLGTFGKEGSGPGQFEQFYDLEFNSTDTLLYIPDTWNTRVQYFTRNEPRIIPTSLGRLKAIYR